MHLFKATTATVHTLTSPFLLIPLLYPETATLASPLAEKTLPFVFFAHFRPPCLYEYAAPVYNDPIDRFIGKEHRS